MTEATLFPNWQDKVVYEADGPHPQPQVLMVDDKVKVLVAGLEPGQQIPEHPEAASVYYFLAGSGWMLVDGERWPVSAGAIITMPAGTVRGLEAETRLAFLATRIA